MRTITKRKFSLVRGCSLLLIAGAPLAAGCVSRDAGYADLRALLEARGQPAPSSKRGERVAPDGATRALLRRPLTADGAARLALLNHPDAALAVASVGIAHAELVANAALPNPHAELGLKYGHGSPRLELGVMQSLTGFVLYSAKRSAADARLQAAALEAAQALLSVGYGAQIQFYKLQALEKKLTLQRDALQMVYASYDAARRLRTAGNITELALARQQAAYESVRLGLAQLESEAVQQRISLASALGTSLETDAGAPTALQLTPMAEADLRAPLFVSPAELKALRDNSLAVTALKQQFTAANSQLDYQRGAGWLPELKAGVNAEREDGEWAFGPGVELELPLFDQGQGEVGVAQANLLRLRAQFDAAAVRVHSFSAAAQERRSQARAQVAYLRGTLLPLHERLVAEAQLQYNAMSIGAFELLSAKHEHLRVLQQGVDAELAYWLAEAEWKLLLAGGVPSSENALSGATAAREVAPMSAGGH